jgi:hypothetical protein
MNRVLSILTYWAALQGAAFAQSNSWLSMDYRAPGLTYSTTNQPTTNTDYSLLWRYIRQARGEAYAFLTVGHYENGEHRSNSLLSTHFPDSVLSAGTNYNATNVAYSGGTLFGDVMTNVVWTWGASAPVTVNLTGAFTVVWDTLTNVSVSAGQTFKMTHGGLTWTSTVASIQPAFNTTNVTEIIPPAPGVAGLVLAYASGSTNLYSADDQNYPMLQFEQGQMIAVSGVQPRGGYSFHTIESFVSDTQIVVRPAMPKDYTDGAAAWIYTATVETNTFRLLPDTTLPELWDNQSGIILNGLASITTNAVPHPTWQLPSSPSRPQEPQDDWTPFDVGIVEEGTILIGPDNLKLWFKVVNHDFYTDSNHCTFTPGGGAIWAQPPFMEFNNCLPPMSNVLASFVWPINQGETFNAMWLTQAGPDTTNTNRPTTSDMMMTAMTPNGPRQYFGQPTVNIWNAHYNRGMWGIGGLLVIAIGR